jgi:hypothetical protein
VTHTARTRYNHGPAVTSQYSPVTNTWRTNYNNGASSTTTYSPITGTARTSMYGAYRSPGQAAVQNRIMQNQAPLLHRQPCSPSAPRGPMAVPRLRAGYGYPR